MKALHYLVLASVLTLACSAEAFISNYRPNNPVLTPPTKRLPAPTPMPRPVAPGPGLHPPPIGIGPPPGPGTRKDPATVIFSQPGIDTIYLNVQGDQYTGPNAGANGHCGQPMWFPYSGSPVYPYPSFVPDTQFLWPGASAPGMSPMTFYGGDGDTNSIGAAGGTAGYPSPTLIYQAHGLQGGNTIGVSLAPRALTSSSANVAVLANYWFCTPLPQPWTAGNGLDGFGLQMAAIMTIPFVYVPVISGQIGTDGTVFIYFVFQIRHVCNCQELIFTPRIMQNRYPQGGDANSDFQYVFGPGNIIWHDVNGDGAMGPEIGNSPYVSSCGNGNFHLGPSSTPLTYCFTISPSQLSSIIQALNAAPSHQVPNKPPGGYDVNASNWQLSIVNINAEAWAPAGSDPRLGFNFNSFTVWGL